MNSTLDFYNENSEDYFSTTVNLNSTNLYYDFLKILPKNGHILDLGCGSGRDSLYFKTQGYKITAIDGSKNLASLASQLLKEEVIVASFDDYNTSDKYDGIWACASLLHIPKKDFKDTILKYSNMLKENGLFYISVKYGQGEAIDRNGRFFCYYTEDSLKEVFQSFDKLKIIQLKITEDIVDGRENIKWINILCQNKK